MLCVRLLQWLIMADRGFRSFVEFLFISLPTDNRMNWMVHHTRGLCNIAHRFFWSFFLFVSRWFLLCADFLKCTTYWYHRNDERIRWYISLLFNIGPSIGCRQNIPFAHCDIWSILRRAMIVLVCKRFIGVMNERYWVFDMKSSLHCIMWLYDRVVLLDRLIMKYFLMYAFE